MPPTETENRAAGGSEAPPAGLRKRALFARAVAWLVVHVYVAGMCAIVLLERRLGLQGEDSLEGLIIFLGIACSLSWARCWWRSGPQT